MAELSGPDRIRHIPHILYHWRVYTGSGSFSTDHGGKAAEAGRRAVAEHLARTGQAARGGAAASPATTGCAGRCPIPPLGSSLIVPTRDRADLLRNCIDGLLHRTDYPDLEVLIVDNASVEPETLALFRRPGAEPRVRILRQDGPFNFSALNNYAVAQATGSLIGFINNDIEVIEPGWLAEMVGHAVRPGVGAVGAKLLYADGKIQHAGVILGVLGVAGHTHKGFGRHDYGYFARLRLCQNLSGVTAACMVMRQIGIRERRRLRRRQPGHRLQRRRSVHPHPRSRPSGDLDPLRRAVPPGIRLARVRPDAGEPRPFRLAK